MSGDAMRSEEMTLFRDMARRAFEREISPHIEQWEDAHMVPRELWNTLGAAGLLCPDMPEEYGAAGTESPRVFRRLVGLSRAAKAGRHGCARCGAGHSAESSPI